MTQTIVKSDSYDPIDWRGKTFEKALLTNLENFMLHSEPLKPTY